MHTMSLGDIIGAAIAIAIFVTIAILAVGREPPKKKPLLPIGTSYRFECTCGWVGWRKMIAKPNSIQCPNCNGVAVQLRYRSDTQ